VPEFPTETRDALQEFFRASLQQSPEDRASNMMQCFAFFYNQNVSFNVLSS
jgi:hypothetical protein